MQYVEQDYNIPKSGDELPTYDDLAAQGGPNSRWLSIQYVHLHRVLHELSGLVAGESG
jgi:hypothetical protein